MLKEKKLRGLATEHLALESIVCFRENAWPGCAYSDDQKNRFIQHLSRVLAQIDVSRGCRGLTDESRTIALCKKSICCIGNILGVNRSRNMRNVRCTCRYACGPAVKAVSRECRETVAYTRESRLQRHLYKVVVVTTQREFRPAGTLLVDPPLCQQLRVLTNTHAQCPPAHYSPTGKALPMFYSIPWGLGTRCALQIGSIILSD